MTSISLLLLVSTLTWSGVRSLALGPPPDLARARNSSTNPEDGHSLRADAKTSIAAPNLWSSFNRRSSWSSEEQPPPFWANRGRREGLDVMLYDVQDLPIPPGDRYRREENLYANEPRWVLLQRREQEPTALAVKEEFDPFWVARGRRYDTSSFTEPFWHNEHPIIWPERIRRGLMESSEEPFWASRGRRSHKEQTSFEEPFWAARGRRGLMESLEEPFWAARGRRAVPERSSEEPFWAARGRRGMLESLEEPFWAARGRRGLKESLSVEEPFWAARGKKGAKADSFQDLMSKVRTRGAMNDLDPFWAARGKRQPSSSAAVRALGRLQAADPFWAARGKREDADSANPEDDTFWSTLERKSTALRQ